MIQHWRNYFNFLMKPCLILAGSTIAACSGNNASSDVVDSSQSYHSSKAAVTLKLNISPRVTKGFSGDFTNVSFSIQERPWKKLLDGRLDCTLQADSRVDCETTHSLAQLVESKPYRIIIFSQKSANSNDKGNDEVACDYFIYNKLQIPTLDITPTSSGECLIWQLQYDTGYSEEEIRSRVRHILNDDQIPDDYDLPLTLYNLYKSYDSEHDWVEALREVTRLVKTNEQLSTARKSQIEGSGRLFF